MFCVGSVLPIGTNSKKARLWRVFIIHIEYNSRMTRPNLADDNTLRLLDNGVWAKADAADRSFIDYTDGDSTEARVRACVEAADDRSVCSEQLDRDWESWALEYHLGSRRSNIYRGLNLKGVKTVLEVGCGCGAITRFLGEQGFQVDAIEGTPNRAEIARLRTSDLENVQIVCSNYHELVLPKASYDLVVFTGVLEYSGAYAPEGISPEAQLKLTLQHAQAALSEAGQILIAIENRTGFKYLAGANEDHLNVPYIGLYGYSEPMSNQLTRGIRTWGKREWSLMLDEFGFGAYQFCYPFPDYKVPDAILSEHFLNSTRFPDQVLGGIRSRDYVSMWTPRLSEPLFWRAAAQTASLDEYANSFLIVVGNVADKVAQTIDFDFVRFASLSRKPAYRLQVEKKQDEAFVRRYPLESGRPDVVVQNAVVTQTCIESEPFVDGQVLEQLWCQALSVVPSFEELAAHIRVYSEWLDTILAQGANHFVDAVPGNVVIDGDGRWHLIDQEWHAVNDISKQIILFRALLHFALKNRELFLELEMEAVGRDMYTADVVDFPAMQTLDDFIGWGFSVCGMDYAICRAQCLEFETGMQNQVTRPEFVSELSGILSDQAFRENFGHTMEVRAYWTQIDGIWHRDHSVEARVPCSEEVRLSLELPGMICNHRYFRIDLRTDLQLMFRGVLDLQNLDITVIREDGAQDQVYCLQSTQALFDQAKLKGFRLLAGDDFTLLSAGGSIILDLSGVDWGEHIASIHLNLAIGVSEEINTIAEHQRLRGALRQSARRLRVRQHILDSQKSRIDEASERLVLLEKKVAQSSTTRLGKLLGRFGLMRKYRV